MKKAILFGPCIGEMYWEFGRFAPILNQKRKQYGDDVTYIICTRPDRFDMYGDNCDILVPLTIQGDNDIYTQDCYGLSGYKGYEYLIKTFYDSFKDEYKIIEHLYPDLGKSSGGKCNKNKYDLSKFTYDYKPRIENKILVDEFLPKNDKKNIVISPRFRKGISKRNWPYWNDLYNKIDNDIELKDKYNFIICGKKPDYIVDIKDRFLDINDIKITNESSLIGLTIEILKRSCYTIGSQSAIPNVSLLFNVPVISWGNEKKLHTITYNVFNTKIDFIEDKNFRTPSKEIFKLMKRLL